MGNGAASLRWYVRNALLTSFEQWMECWRCSTRLCCSSFEMLDITLPEGVKDPLLEDNTEEQEEGKRQEDEWLELGLNNIH
jgi:hypothetical protein